MLKIKMKFILALLICVFDVLVCIAEQPQTIGGFLAGSSQADYVFDALETSSGEIIVAGGTGAFEAPRLMKVDAQGNVEWYVHTNSPVGQILLEPDGYVISSGYFIFKVNFDGSIQWNKRFADTNTGSFLRPLAKARSGGFVAAGDFSTMSTEMAWEALSPFLL